MSNYTAVAKGEPATSSLREQHARRVVDAAQDSHSAVTRRNYLAAWRRFSEWADREGFGAIPALPGTVAAYLAERAANGLSPASLRLDRAAIRYHHTDAGHANPADNEGVRRVLRGLTPAVRRARVAPRNRPPLSRRRGWPRSVRLPSCGARDRAVEPSGPARPAAAVWWISRSHRSCGTPCCGAPRLRRSRGPTCRFGATGPRASTVRRSKSDQDGNGATLYVGRAAAAELRAIHRPDASPKAPVFGLRSGRAVSNRIAAAAKGAGLTGRFSGHSPRVGMARDLVASGEGVAALQVAGRWASVQMLAHYARAELAAKGAVARFHGED